MSAFDYHSSFLANLPSDHSSASSDISAGAQHSHDTRYNRRNIAMATAATTASGGSTITSGSPRRNMLVVPPSKLQTSPSFADFFSASTPVPASVTLLLSYTSPAIHACHRLLQLLTWTSDRSVKSFLVLFAWWGICLGTETFLIYGLHGALMLYIGHLWINSRKAAKVAADIPLPQSPGTPQSGKFSFSSGGSNRSNSALLSPTSARHPTSTQLEQAVTLREIQEILDHWAAWHRTLDRVVASLNWSDRGRTRAIVVLLFLTYVPWLVLNYFVPMRFIVTILGSVAICWRAPWFAILWAVAMKLQAFSPLLQLVPYWPYHPEVSASYRKKKRFSVKDIISRAIGQRKKNDSEGRTTYKTSTGYDIEEDHATMYYKFVLYENQRWWLGLEWTPMMLPNDRSPWTDDHLEPTQSKSSFQLPPPYVAHEAIPGQPNKVLRKSQEWRWLDPHWRLKMGAESDMDGWEYANNHWQKWTGKNRRGAYTRRRAWERTAKLIDQREIVLLEDVEEEIAMSEDDQEEQTEEQEAKHQGASDD